MVQAAGLETVLQWYFQAVAVCWRWSVCGGGTEYSKQDCGDRRYRPTEDIYSSCWNITVFQVGYAVLYLFFTLSTSNNKTNWQSSSFHKCARVFHWGRSKSRRCIWTAVCALYSDVNRSLQSKFEHALLATSPGNMITVQRSMFMVFIQCVIQYIKPQTDILTFVWIVFGMLMATSWMTLRRSAQTMHAIVSDEQFAWQSCLRGLNWKGHTSLSPASRHPQAWQNMD